MIRLYSFQKELSELRIQFQALKERHDKVVQDNLEARTLKPAPRKSNMPKNTKKVWCTGKERLRDLVAEREGLWETIVDQREKLRKQDQLLQDARSVQIAETLGEGQKDIKRKKLE
ncbi:hypothetical protein QFC24_005727 [Naganishia onofrii]|uniref:Uncharacterized protein n=1 Tax=Naganishia onofrii TaxID=1851511 RepID=A0ACC2X9P1_9TREE|nr:hypothetical protein QFC24_005727 [Naganishia onofrii]